MIQLEKKEKEKVQETHTDTKTHTFPHTENPYKLERIKHNKNICKVKNNSKHSETEKK